MALRIFETDPDARPKPRQFADDFTGRFRSGRLNGNRPESLSSWRVTTGDPEVAAALAEHFGGTPEEWPTTGEDFLEVTTSTAKVRVIVDGPEALTADMKLWGRQGLIHHCDGVMFLSPEVDAGKLCGCPELLAERKAFAKSGRGPQPSINLVFRLVDDPGLGLFRFQSASWKLAEVLHEIHNALAAVDGPALAELSLELVEFTTKKGQDVSFFKPTVKVLGTWEGTGTA